MVKGRTMLSGFSDALDAQISQRLDANRKAELLQQLKTARQSGDLPAAVALRSQLLAIAASDDERVEMLQGLAEDALAAAANALARALKIRKRNQGLLQRLRAVYEAAGLWREAVDAGVAFAETIAEAARRARALVSAAELSSRDPEGVGRALALYDAAISDDPELPGAFESMEKLLVDAKDHAGLEGAYERQIERLRQRNAEGAELALYDRLARLREELGDKQGAAQALDRLVARRPADVGARGRLAGLLEALGHDDLAVRCLEVAAQHAPAHAETYRAMNRVFSRTRDADRSYQACSVLVQLGEADIDEQLYYQQHAPHTTTRASKPLDAASWGALLPEALDADLLEVILAAAPGAVATRLEQMRAAKQLPQLDPRDQHDPEKSTVSAVRTVAYAAWLLGMPVPHIYASKNEVPGGMALLATQEPTIVLGPSVLSGRSVPELTFVAARNLASLRLTGRVLAFYPTLAELKSVFASAFATPSPAVARLTQRGGQVDLIAWARATEIAACRAGLLASGDISVAARMLSFDGRVVGGLSAADRLKSLLPFTVSSAHTQLRRAVGAAITS